MQDISQDQPIEPEDKPLNSKPSKTKAGLKIFFDSIKIIVILGLLALFFRFFLLQPYLVDGPSMEPNFYNGDYLLVEKVSQKISGFDRGDVIVFKYPVNPQLVFIKRIIGIPGDKIELIDNKIKIINSENPNGEFLDEPYLPDDFTTEPNQKTEFEIGADQYFVLGDHRTNSLDSRVWGTVPKNLIIGKAWFRALPSSNIGLIRHPDYNITFNELFDSVFAFHRNKSKIGMN